VGYEKIPNGYRESGKINLEGIFLSNFKGDSKIPSKDVAVVVIYELSLF